MLRPRRRPRLRVRPKRSGPPTPVQPWMPGAAGGHEGVRPHVEPDGGARRRGWAASGRTGVLEGPLQLDAEVGRHGGADGVVARDAEADADADLAVGLLEDVG